MSRSSAAPCMRSVRSASPNWRRAFRLPDPRGRPLRTYGARNVVPVRPSRTTLFRVALQRLIDVLTLILYVGFNRTRPASVRMDMHTGRVFYFARHLIVADVTLLPPRLNYCRDETGIKWSVRIAPHHSRSSDHGGHPKADKIGRAHV